MNGVILILVMAEEKWQEADFLRQEIQSEGYKAAILDMGLIGQPQGPCDITREEVILASDRDPKEVALITDRGQRMPIMTAGGIRKVKELYSEGKLDAIMTLGGSTGTQMGTDIMKSLPYGLPKLAISCVANVLGFSNLAFGTSDIAMISTVVEFTGTNNTLMQNVLSRAAGAICGMVKKGSKVPLLQRGKGEKLIAVTQWGSCETCATSTREQLESMGYQVVGFHADGINDRAMEEIIERDNIFEAVVDLVPAGVGEELFDFGRKAGPTRLEVTGKMGVPQIVAPSGVNIGSPLSRNYRSKPELLSRKKYEYDARRTFIRLSRDELVLVAQTMAEKLNKAKGPVKFLIPLGGWSSADMRGTDFYDGELDRVFVDELRKKLRRDIEIREVDADLDTREFAQAVVEALNDVMVK